MKRRTMAVVATILAVIFGFGLTMSTSASAVTPPPDKWESGTATPGPDPNEPPAGSAEVAKPGGLESSAVMRVPATQLESSTSSQESFVEDGGWGNFYKARQCSPSGQGMVLVAKLTNYDINVYTDQRYHHSVGTYNSAWSYVATFVDGWIWASELYKLGYDMKGYSGRWWDGYTSFRNMTKYHKFQFMWRNQYNQVVSCSIYI